MKSLFRASTPDDSARLTALFAEAFDCPPDSSLFNPALMAWKYWDHREDWTEPRSYVLERDGRIIAHAGLWPAKFGDGQRWLRGYPASTAGLRLCRAYPRVDGGTAPPSIPADPVAPARQLEARSPAGS